MRDRSLHTKRRLPDFEFLKLKFSSPQFQAQVCFFEDDAAMRTLITHARNPLMGWDINVNLTADATQKIAYIEIRVNDFQKVEDTPEIRLTPGITRSRSKVFIPAQTQWTFW